MCSCFTRPVNPVHFEGKFDIAFDQAIRSGGSHPIEVFEESIDAQRFPGVDKSQLLKGYLKASTPIETST